MISVRTRSRNSGAAAMLLALLAAPVPAAGSPLDEAVELYDAARYAEALPLLERVVEDGGADGITYYRLYYCRRAAGREDATAALETAARLLEEQVGQADGFEPAFYLASAYTNLGKAGEVPRVSAQTTARFEAGRIDAPDTAREQFRLGKLYADQGRDLDAQPWFEQAVEGFAAAAEARNLPYLEWAARWLGERAVKDERYEAAAGHYGHIRAAGKASRADLDALALASLMIGDYETAGDAWRAAARINPADADRYRYGAGLAQLAAAAGSLPISPDGERSWEEASREELETILREQSQKVRETRAEIEAAGELSVEQRSAFGEKLVEPRPLFTAAAMEYLRRGLSLREAAFFGGYAPLIFKAREWRLAPPPTSRMTPAEAADARERMKAEREKKRKPAENE